jgi:spermidine/putrescine transport system permease protein
VTSRRLLGAAWPTLVITTVLLFLYGPALTTFVLSLNTSSVTGFPIRGISTHWYTTLWRDEQFRDALTLSVKLAAVSTAISVAIATPAAIAVARGTHIVTKTVATLYAAPLLIPPLVFAISAATAARLLGIRLSFLTLVAGHVVLTAPVVYLFVSARLRGFDWSLPLAARVLGASPRQAFLRVTAPLLLPAIAGGAILAFVISMDNFVVSLFLSAGQTTVPLLIWSRMREFFDPAVNAMASLFIAFTLVAALFAERLARTRVRTEGSDAEEGGVVKVSPT